MIQKKGNGYMSKLEAQQLVKPSLGRFQRTEEIIQRTDGMIEFKEWLWHPVRVPEMGQSRSQIVESVSLPYEVLLEDITTREDQNQRIEGIKMTLRERATQRVIAQKTVFIQWPEQSSAGTTSPARVCPKSSGELSQCSSPFECDFAGPFVFQVLKPVVNLPEQDLFHLHRGMTKTRYWDCSSDILVAPGISASDIEWWSGGREGWEDLHLRVRGLDAELVCSEFHWGGAMFRPVIRFSDGSQVQTKLIAKAYKGKGMTPARLISELIR